VGIWERQRRLSQGTSARIVDLLRRGPLTIDEIAGAVGLTRTAVRAQLATLQRDGIVEEREPQRGPSKPARTYGVKAEAELLLSRAYIPILSQLLHVLADRMSHEEFDGVMREVGRGLMKGRAMPQGTLRERVAAASTLLNDLGGMTEVDEDDGVLVIRGHGCPLAAATAKYPEACNALESLLSEFVGQPVNKCCDQYQRQRCCFEVSIS
jgi:DeoR family transcriptional regulator, suf operon transcriptional repressor